MSSLLLMASAAAVVAVMAAPAIPPSTVVDGVKVSIGDVPELKKREKVE